MTTPNGKRFFQCFLQISLRSMNNLVHFTFLILEEFGHPNLLGKLNESPTSTIGMLGHPNAPLHESQFQPLHYS